MVHESPNDSASRNSTSEVRTQPPFALNAQPIESGLEVAPASEHDKQFVNPVREGDKEVINHGEKEVVASDRPIPYSDEHTKATSRKLCGLERGLFWVLVAVVVLVVALGVGLGVGLSSRESSKSSATSTPTSSPTPFTSEELRIGGSLDDSYYSTSGAWNGSGIAQVWQNFAQNFTDTSTANAHEIVVYYQHHTGEIRWLRESENATQTWQAGPSDVAIVASDARNSTPITALHYDINGTNYWHVFYIDSDNRIQQRSGNNQTSQWTDGSIGKANLRPWNGDLVGMQVCWAVNSSVPIRFFYASDNTTFEEYLWFTQDDSWVWQRSWKGYRGTAGVGCHIGGPFYRYVGMVNLDNQLEFWYQVKSSDDLSAEWLKAGNAIDNVHSASSVSFIQPAVAWQERLTGRIKVSSMVWEGETTRSINDYSPDVAYKGLLGTRIDAMAVGKEVVYVFYQRLGEDVAWISRNLESDNAWTPSMLPV